MMGPTEPVVSGIIAYNGDSQRGWNDPPTLSFINASKKGPKIDLRKRVSHQEALTGRKITSPSCPTVNPFNIQPSQVTTGLSNVVLGQPSFQPDQSPSPCHSRHSSGSYTPPLEHQKCPSPILTQYPIHTYASTNTNIFPVPPSTVYPLMPVTTTNVVCPMIPTTSTMATVLHPIPLVPSTITPPPQISSPVTTLPPSSLGNPLFSPKCLNMTPISSALDTSHVRSNPDISLEPPQQDCRDFLQNILSSFPNQDATSPLIFNPSPTTSNNFPPNFINGNQTSPVLHRSGSGPRLYTPPPISGSGRNSPVPPPPIMNQSPVSTPTGVHSGRSTPRSNSPESSSNEGSRHNSDDFDTQEAMNITVEALEETILKCSNILKNRDVEDVKKKVVIMKQQWADNQLSLPVQKTMKSLAKALLECDTQTSHKLHVQLMVDYVGEVKQWMVAIKRLISAVRSLHI